PTAARAAITATKDPSKSPTPPVANGLADWGPDITVIPFGPLRRFGQVLCSQGTVARGDAPPRGKLRYTPPLAQPGRATLGKCARWGRWSSKRVPGGANPAEARRGKTLVLPAPQKSPQTVVARAEGLSAGNR